MTKESFSQHFDKGFSAISLSYKKQSIVSYKDSNPTLPSRAVTEHRHARRRVEKVVEKGKRFLFPKISLDPDSFELFVLNNITLLNGLPASFGNFIVFNEITCKSEHLILYDWSRFVFDVKELLKKREQVKSIGYDRKDFSGKEMLNSFGCLHVEKDYWVLQRHIFGIPNCGSDSSPALFVQFDLMNFLVEELAYLVEEKYSLSLMSLVETPNNFLVGNENDLLDGLDDKGAHLDDTLKDMMTCVDCDGMIDESFKSKENKKDPISFLKEDIKLSGGVGGCVLRTNSGSFIFFPYAIKKGQKFIDGINYDGATQGRVKEYVRSRFERIKNILSTIFPLILKNEGISETKLRVILQFFEKKRGIDFSSIIDSNGNILNEEIVGKEEKWMIHLHQKLILGLSKKTYCYLSENEGYTPISTIYKKMNEFLEKNEDFFKIVEIYEMNKKENGEIERVSRHGGLAIPIQKVIVSAVETNIDVVLDSIIGTRDVLKHLNSINPDVFMETGESKSPIYISKRRFSIKRNGRSTSCHCTIGVGLHHDGAQNFYKILRLFGKSDQKSFELGTLNFFDGMNSRELKKYCIFFLIFADMTREKYIQFLSKHLREMFSDLDKIELKVMLSYSLAKQIDDTFKEGDSFELFLTFTSVLSNDMKAMLFHTLEDGTKSGRVGVTSKVKLVPYFKPEYVKEFEKIKKISCMDSNFVLPFKELYLCSANLELLFGNPLRDSLYLPYGFLVDGEMSPVSKKSTEPLHAVISLERFFLGVLDAFLKTLSKAGITSKDTTRKWYTMLVKKGLVKYENTFGKVDCNAIEYDFTKRLEVLKNWNTCKGKKYNSLFSNEFIEQLTSLLNEVFEKKNADGVDLPNEKFERFNNLIKKSLSIFKEVWCETKYFCDCFWDENMLEKKEIIDCGEAFDFIYIFASFSIQISKSHSDYILDLICTLPIDLFFRMVLGRNGMHAPERANAMVRLIIDKNSSKFHRKIGKRILRRLFSILGKNDRADLDAYSNTALQVVLPMIAKCMDFLFKKKEVEVEVIQSRKETVVSGNSSGEKCIQLLNQPPELSNARIKKRLSSFYNNCYEWINELSSVVSDLDSKVTLSNWKKFGIIMSDVFDYQREFVDILETKLNEDRSSVVLAWEPGLGKTLPIILWVSLLVNSNPTGFVLVIVLNNLICTWRDMFKKWDSYFGTLHKLELVNEKEDFFKIIESSISSKIILTSIESLRLFIEKIAVDSDTLETMKKKFFQKILFIACDEFHMYLQGNIIYDKNNSVFSLVPSSTFQKKKKQIESHESEKSQLETLTSTANFPLKVSPNSEILKLSDEKSCQSSLSQSPSQISQMSKENLLTKGEKKKIKEEKKKAAKIEKPKVKPKKMTFAIVNNNVTKQSSDVDTISMLKWFSGNAMFCFISGTPFRNESCFVNLLYLVMNDDTVFLEKKVLKDLFSSVNNMYCSIVGDHLIDVFKNAVDFLKKKISGRMFVRSPSLSAKLFYFIMQFHPTDNQKNLLPTFINAANKISVDRISLSELFFDANGLKKVQIEDKIKKMKEIANDISVENNIEKFGTKLKGIVCLVQSIFDNKINYKRYKKEKNLPDDIVDIESIPVEVIPNKYYEKIIIISSMPYLLQQVRLVLEFCIPNIVGCCIEITGNESDSERYENKLKFENGKFMICFVSTKVGGVGLTFTEARFMIQLEADFDHIWGTQGVGREYRIGQSEDVFCFLFLIADSGKKLGQISIFRNSLMKDLFSRCILSSSCDYSSITSNDEFIPQLDQQRDFFIWKTIEKINSKESKTYKYYFNELRDLIFKKPKERMEDEVTIPKESMEDDMNEVSNVAEKKIN